MKRIAFCFDGTWDQIASKWPYPTNVVLTAQSITPRAKDGTIQIIHYDAGVGTSFASRYLGGLFGLGVLSVLVNAYTFLIFNYEIGDEIFVFGFSRGAFTARAFVGMLRKIGILPRSKAAEIYNVVKKYKSGLHDLNYDSDELCKFRLKNSPVVCVDSAEDAWRCQNKPGYRSGDTPILRIRYLGVWDTVASIGIAQGALAPLITRLAPFYNTDLTSMVVSARHALAIDEQRDSFSPTLWNNFEELNQALGSTNGKSDAPYQQKWFPGGHGSVGGGGPVRGLSDSALEWVISGARIAGLEMDVTQGSVIYELHPNALADLNNLAGVPTTIFDKFLDHLPKRPRLGPTNLFEISATVITRWRAAGDTLPEKKDYRPRTLDQIAGAVEALVAKSTQDEIPVPPGNVVVTSNPTPNAHYTVVQGDTLREIAQKAYGRATSYELILKANEALLNNNPDRIYVGQIIWIPEAP